MTLRAKILAPIALVSALLVAFLFGYWMPGQLREKEDEIRGAAQKHLSTVADSFVPYLLSHQLDAAHEVLNTMRRRDPRWVALELSVADGSALHPLDRDSGIRATRADEVIVRQPIAADDVQLGVLTVRIDVHEELAEARRRHGQLVGVALLAVLAYVGTVLLVLERNVRKPLGQLAEASKRLASGEFDAPLDRAGAVEVRALVDSFASMRESIRGYQAELIAKNDSLQSLSAAVAQGPISVVITGRDGLVEFASPRFYELTGQAPEETLGRPCEVISGACLGEAQREEVRRAVALGNAWRGEMSRARRGGKPFHASVFLTPVRDEGERIAHWLVMMEDVTHQRALEQQLVQAQKMEALGTLAGGIAHDFNNVLSPIIGYTELARTHAANDPELSGDLAQVSEAAFRARDLVRQILTFSRKAEKKKVPLHVSAVAREALKLLRSSIPSTIEIRQRFERDGQVLADPTQVHQVIMNLCTNAFHAMEQTGGVLAVTVDEVEIAPEHAAAAELPPGRYVMLAVSDTGVGMSRETQARMFDPYFTTKEKGKGTGLGLAVVDGIVRGHDGRISVYSEPGAGTTFKVYLPISERATPGATAPAVAAAGATTGHESVLVVDDEESIRSVLARGLKDAGYRVAVHAGAAEALEALGSDPTGWDLLITDMTMPGMNGKELARLAMERRPGFPVILCCGYSSLINAEEARRMGIRAYVEKPVVMREFLRCVREVLDAGAVKVA